MTTIVGYKNRTFTCTHYALIHLTKYKLTYA